MARVIKAGAGQATARPARPATRVLAQADVKKVIEKELYLAKQEAEELLKRAEDERRRILSEGKQQAAQSREQAMTLGASQAFAAAADEALSAFRARADRYGEAADDIRILAVEIATKLLGQAPDLSARDIETILNRGLSTLRAKRKVRVLVPVGRRAALSIERPNLMKAVAAQPDVLVEEAADVGVGFARVVTEVGGALCAEDSAMEALAQAVNIKEQRRQLAGDGASNSTQVGIPPRGPRGRTSPTADLHAEDDASEIVGRPGAVTSDVEDIASIAADEDPDASVPDLESLPDAAIEEDDADETRALPAPLLRPRVSSPAPSTAATATRPAAVRADAPRVQAGAGPRAATRVLPMDAQDALREKARGPQAKVGTPRPARSDDDDDMELFTDARPVGRR